MAGQLRRLDESRLNDFFAVHSQALECGWCNCVAWWVPTWEGWGERTAAENRELREKLFREGHYDGYIYYAGGAPVAWCQVGVRDRLEKLVRQFALPPDPEVWALTCLLVAPAHRRAGVARRMLEAVIEDLRSRGVRRLQAYPKKSDSTDPLDLWCGPRRLLDDLAFRRSSPETGPLVMELEL